MDRISLFVAGQIYEGWTEATVTTAIEQIAGDFSLSITERWDGQLEGWQIPCGEFCQIKIDNEVVISGYVDSIDASYDSGSHTITVAGRDVTGDLVDCSAPSKNYTGQTIVQIMQDLAKPYGIKIVDKLTDRQSEVKTSTKIQALAVQNGDSVFETMDRAAKQLGVMLVSDGNGSIHITSAGQAGSAGVDLVQGVNILSASFTQDHSELYSEITVKGQTSGLVRDGIDGDVSGANPQEPKKNTHPKATVKQSGTLVEFK